jgi:transposase
MAGDSEFTLITRRLACLRRVSTLTAFALAVEIGHGTRFIGNSIGSFVGLVPSEYSSGPSRVQGSITKTGNTHARRPCSRSSSMSITSRRSGSPLAADKQRAAGRRIKSLRVGALCFGARLPQRGRSG